MPSAQHPPFPAYKGDENYIFISYAHRDSAIVFPELIRMRSWGFNIWYDEGIDPGNEWPDEIAIALRKASFFVFFVSPRAVGSVNCRNEVYFALDQKKPFLCIYLTDTNIADINAGLALSIGSLQAVMKHQMDEASYEQKLHRALSKEFPKDHVPGVLPAKKGVPGKPPNSTGLIIGLLAGVVILLGVICAVLLIKTYSPSSVHLEYVESPTNAPTEAPVPTPAPEVTAPTDEPTLAPLFPPPTAPTTPTEAPANEPNLPPLFPPPRLPGLLAAEFMFKGPFEYRVEAANAQDYPALKDPVYVIFTFKHAATAAGRSMINLKPGEGSWFDRPVASDEPSECRIIVDRADTESFKTVTDHFMPAKEGGFGLRMKISGSYFINKLPYYAKGHP